MFSSYVIDIDFVKNTTCLVAKAKITNLNVKFDVKKVKLTKEATPNTSGIVFKSGWSNSVIFGNYEGWSRNSNALLLTFLFDTIFPKLSIEHDFSYTLSNTRSILYMDIVHEETSCKIPASMSFKMICTSSGWYT